MHIHRTLPLGFLFAGVLLALAGCGPSYPNCETDKDCKTNPKEFCVARKCQQCRDSRDCPTGSQCNGGKCGAIAGYCTDRSQCAAGQECIANRCRPCEGDGECPAGLKCMQGSCRKPMCTKDDDCPQNQECQNGACVGKAASAGAPPCPLGPVYFGFDQASLTAEATATLNTNAECLKRPAAAARNVDLVGRADPRGTTEYNMALSDRRSQAVRDYLQRLGVNVGKLNKIPRGALDASGTDEASWAKDRRVDFDWK
jgi:peptidoglycan-associated lipoprotein